MKNKIFLVIIIGIAVFMYSRETIMDKLMSVNFPIVTNEGSGIQFYDPEPNTTADVVDQLERGLVSIIYVFNPNCRSCQIFDTNLKKFIMLRPDVAVTKMPVSGVRYKIRYKGGKLNAKNLPFIMIFDRAGELVASDNGDEHDAYDLFYKWLQEEVDRKNAQLKEEWVRKQTS